MVIEGPTRPRQSPRSAGLRMSADEYLSLRDDGGRYELINGVVLMSPSPSFGHQMLAGSVFESVAAFVRARRLGVVVYETDVRFASDLVYRPDIAMYAGKRAAGITGTPAIAPDFIVEVLSPGTEAMDLRTKRDDYERAGVREYWAIGVDSARHFVLEGGRYSERLVTGDKLVSAVIQGFTLDLAEARRGIALD